MRLILFLCVILLIVVSSSSQDNHACSLTTVDPNTPSDGSCAAELGNPPDASTWVAEVGNESPVSVDTEPTSASSLFPSCSFSGAQSECSLLILKPDALSRGLVGKILSRIEDKGFQIAGVRTLLASNAKILSHYAHIAYLPFFPEVVQYMQSGPILAVVVSGNNVVKSLRTMAGDTNPVNAAPGTLRGDLAVSIDKNLVHTSDSIDSAIREIELWMK